MTEPPHDWTDDSVPAHSDTPPLETDPPPGPNATAPPWATDLAVMQATLRNDFERLAGAVTPLLTNQFRDMEARLRNFEQRLRLRQERPLILMTAGLLNDIRRLESDADVRAHVDNSLEKILTGIGYQFFGRVGDSFDPNSHEAVGGQLGDASVIRVVHTQGLACFGETIIRARVEIEPLSDTVRLPGEESL